MLVYQRVGPRVQMGLMDDGLWDLDGFGIGMNGF